MGGALGRGWCSVPQCVGCGPRTSLSACWGRNGLRVEGTDELEDALFYVEMWERVPVQQLLLLPCPRFPH